MSQAVRCQCQVGWEGRASIKVELGGNHDRNKQAEQEKEAPNTNKKTGYVALQVPNGTRTSGEGS